MTTKDTDNANKKHKAQVKTRMAPSPTGEYHVGALRTMLYNYAYAKQQDGKFILRIEDTDQTREVEGATQRILAVIKDYGLSWDEGPEVGGPSEPYVQSQRLGLYKQYAEQLVAYGHAYYCFCSEERLAELRKTQQENGLPPKYDKKCLSLSPEEIAEKLEKSEKYVIRLNVPDGEKIEFEDLVYGHLEFLSSDVDDQVLLKSDGFPTYHLGVVVDDYLMGITHILRGNEWLPSTPKHILLYKAFGWELPVYAHVPLLKEKDGTKKLSKRHGAVHARGFLEEGYLPEAMLNFLMFLGWNPGTEKEIYTLEEFISDFSLAKIHKTDLVSFDRDKLLWYNGHYIRQKSPAELWQIIQKWASDYGVELGINADGENDSEAKQKILRVVELVQERLKTLSDFPQFVSYFFTDPKVDSELAQSYAGAKTAEIVTGFSELFTAVEEWSSVQLDTVSHDFIAQKGYKPKEAFMTLRVVVSGVIATPPIFDTLEVLGKETVLHRLKSFLGEE